MKAYEIIWSQTKCKPFEILRKHLEASEITRDRLRTTRTICKPFANHLWTTNHMNFIWNTQNGIWWTRNSHIPTKACTAGHRRCKRCRRTVWCHKRSRERVGRALATQPLAPATHTQQPAQATSTSSQHRQPEQAATRPHTRTTQQQLIRAVTFPELHSSEPLRIVHVKRCAKPC